MAEIRTIVMMDVARMYTDKRIFLWFEFGASIATTSFSAGVYKSEKNIRKEFYEYLQRVLGFASVIRLSFDRHHTCHCVHWSGVGVGISGLLLTPCPQD